jgi:hypothetical protein
MTDAMVSAIIISAYNILGIGGLVLWFSMVKRRYNIYLCIAAFLWGIGGCVCITPYLYEHIVECGICRYIISIIGGFEMAMMPVIIIVEIAFAISHLKHSIKRARLIKSISDRNFDDLTRFYDKNQ